MMMMDATNDDVNMNEINGSTMNCIDDEMRADELPWQRKTGWAGTGGQNGNYISSRSDMLQYRRRGMEPYHIYKMRSRK